jgi:hypothetical protein
LRNLTGDGLETQRTLTDAGSLVVETRGRRGPIDDIDMLSYNISIPL